MDISKICIYPIDMLHQTTISIDQGVFGIALVPESKQRLIRIITDGNVPRCWLGPTAHVDMRAHIGEGAVIRQAITIGAAVDGGCLCACSRSANHSENRQILSVSPRSSL